MFFWLSNAAAPHPSVITRAVLAALATLAVSLLLGSRAIAWLQRRFREPIVGDSATLNALHRSKQSTPTMGGLFILTTLLTVILLLGDWQNLHLLPAVMLIVGLGALGAADDLQKIATRRGLSARAKLAGQTVVATAASLLLYWHHAELPGGLAVQFPGTGILFDAGGWFVLISAVTIVGTSNAVNLTDGLDGLAAGCLVSAMSAIAVLTIVAGDVGLAGEWDVVPIMGASELTVLAGGTIGALLGFLWFNRHPAKVFMGDTGSLPLGGLLGFMAVAVRQELLLAIIGGVFVVEAASVLIQVGVYKWRRRRVFRCAPLHHHFQFLGWPEPLIVGRFWAASVLLAILGLSTLLRSSGGNNVATPPSLARRADVHIDDIRPSPHAENVP